MYLLYCTLKIVYCNSYTVLLRYTILYIEDGSRRDRPPNNCPTACGPTESRGPGRRGAAPRALRPESAARGRLKSTWSWTSLPGGPFTNAKTNCTARHSYLICHCTRLNNTRGSVRTRPPAPHPTPDPCQFCGVGHGTARRGAARTRARSTGKTHLTRCVCCDSCGLWQAVEAVRRPRAHESAPG